MNIISESLFNTKSAYILGKCKIVAGKQIDDFMYIIYILLIYLKAELEFYVQLFSFIRKYFFATKCSGN